MSRWKAAEAWLLAAVGVAPFLLIYFAQALNTPRDHTDTWFLQYDFPYYEANGRAIFERGNGLSGPNPYDPDPAAPDIYFQWLIWLLGVGVVALRLDAGRFLFVVGATGALVFSRLTLSLVEQRGGTGRARVPLFLLAMWGSGVTVALALTLWASSPGRGPVPLLHFEPMGGWWMHCWGRNTVGPTESVYHALMAGVWLSALARRWWACIAGLALIATTHPFTGFQALAIFIPWSIAGLFWRGEDRIPAWFVGGVVGIAAVFLGYYLVFLPSFPQHARLQNDWSLLWGEHPIQTAALYALVAVPAMAGLARDRFRIDLDLLLLLTIAAVSLGLTNHHWFVKARQPLHFAHGYVWMPLYLLGVPVLRDALEWASRKPARIALAAAIGAFACADNVVWVGSQILDTARVARCLAETGQRGPVDLRYIPDGLRAAYRDIQRRGLRGVLLSDDPIAAYLAASYTGCRVAYGHVHNTPQYEERRRRALEWLDTGRDEPSPSIDVILTRDAVPPGLASGWQRTFASGAWSVFERADLSDPPARIVSSGSSSRREDKELIRRACH